MKRMLLLSACLLASAPASAAEPAPGAGMDHSAHCGLPTGDGRIDALNVPRSRATIAHEPIPALGWDEMTMEFSVGKAVDLAAFAAGDRVHFLLSPDKKAKSQQIVAMCAADAEAGAYDACMNTMHQTAMTIADASGTPCGAMDHQMDHGAGGNPKDGEPKSGGDHSHH